MKQTFHIGRFGGIPIGANWSVVVIVVLISWVLGSGVLPDLAPNQPWAAYSVVAVLAAVLFFASLVTHELAHSLVARRYGVGVRAITLWMFGGVSELEGEMSSPGEELRMAGAGPVTSFVIGAAFLLGAALAGSSADLRLYDRVGCKAIGYDYAHPGKHALGGKEIDLPASVGRRVLNLLDERDVLTVGALAARQKG